MRHLWYTSGRCRVTSSLAPAPAGNSVAVPVHVTDWIRATLGPCAPAP